MDSVPRRRRILTVVLLHAVSVPVLGAALAVTAAPANAMTTSVHESSIVSAINEFRRNHGRNPLSERASIGICYDRYAENAKGHVRKAGDVSLSYVRDAYTTCDPEAKRHISQRRKKISSIMRAWKSIEDSRRAMLMRSATSIEVGSKRNRDGTWSTVVIIGKPAPATAATTVTYDGSSSSDWTEPAPIGDVQTGYAMRDGIYTATNTERMNAGLSTLRRDSCLQISAQKWANKLAAQGYLEHQDLSRTYQECGAYSLGENVAYNGSSSGAAMVDQWMNSTGHRANILNSRFQRIGVGTAQSAAGYWFAVQLFGD
jgi:uncharacterized protein YkwD